MGIQINIKLFKTYNYLFLFNCAQQFNRLSYDSLSNPSTINAQLRSGKGEVTRIEELGDRREQQCLSVVSSVEERSGQKKICDRMNVRKVTTPGLDSDVIRMFRVKPRRAECFMVQGVRDPTQAWH